MGIYNHLNLILAAQAMNSLGNAINLEEFENGRFRHHLPNILLCRRSPFFCMVVLHHH
eukprot:COSAG02_NODE_1283_length_13471_cov_12.121223_3_plen_58_part_00